MDKKIIQVENEIIHLDKGDIHKDMEIIQVEKTIIHLDK